jgi:glycerophosphoryl diester phosphodiesterase
MSCPENTEAAFRLAVELGADVLETDMHLSADGQVVISHDPDFQRLSGDPRPITSMTVAEMKELDLGSNFRPEEGYPFKGQGLKPLLLEEVLSLFPHSRFNLDLKADDDALAEEAANVIRRAGAENRICVASFHHRVLKTFRRLQPETATSFSKREIIMILFFRGLGILPSSLRRGEAIALQIPEYAGRYRIIRPSLLNWCRKRNLAVQVWTINDPEKMKALLKEGVNAVISDDPETLIQVCRDLDS